MNHNKASATSACAGTLAGVPLRDDDQAIDMLFTASVSRYLRDGIGARAAGAVKRRSEQRCIGGHSDLCACRRILECQRHLIKRERQRQCTQTVQVTDETTPRLKLCPVRTRVEGTAVACEGFAAKLHMWEQVTINQSISQSINQSINQSIEQPTKQRRLHTAAQRLSTTKTSSAGAGIGLRFQVLPHSESAALGG